MPRFLSPKELLSIMAVPLPLGPAPMPIADTDPDPGLFGPESVTWKVLREPLLILAGARALLLQAAHPHVAQGAIDHSSYATDPFGRLMRTTDWAGAVAFGTTAEAEAAAARVNRMHRKVAGTLPRGRGSRKVKAGSAYNAMDPDLLLWVHATFVDTLLVAHDRLVGGLTEPERDAFVHEWDAVARLMGVPEQLLWGDHAAMAAYVDEQVEHGFARPAAGSRLVAATILHPPLPSPLLRPLMDTLAFIAVGFLPATTRKAYRITWTPAHEAAHLSLELMVRNTRRGMPRALRVAPIYDFALSRTLGRLRDGSDRRLQGAA
ncbi:MAG TPA: oxygenase MpaB family protein [Candidatus Solibacter sp.]|jgi:uncharacterized protein (DUF2236 family)|nr:oxygenase MpaB family protein [Candidatus Solibacter sp.]